jgi:hypothetical protein
LPLQQHPRRQQPAPTATSSTQNSTLPYIHNIDTSNMPTGGNSPTPTANQISTTPQMAMPPGSVRYQPSEAILVGHHFPCFQDFKKQILCWALQDKFKTRHLKSNGQINIVGCAEKACNFKVRAHWKKGSERVEGTIVSPNHTACIGARRRTTTHFSPTWFPEA